MGGRRRVYPKEARSPAIPSFCCRNCFETEGNCGKLPLPPVIGAADNLTPIRSEQHNAKHWKKSDTGHTGGEPRASYRQL